MAFDSAAPAASSPPSSSPPFVSTDRLAGTGTGTGEIRAGGGFNKEACWWGRVALREVGGCCCVIGHTFCHPSGTFQLSVATNAAVAGWWHVCPYRPLIHIHSCAQWHVSYWCYHQWSKARGFFLCVCMCSLQSQRAELVLIWTSLALSPNTIQMLLVAFKVTSYPTSLRVLVSYQPRVFFSRNSWHSWIRSPVISPLEWKHRCRPGNLRKDSKAVVKGEECTNDRGYLWQGRLWLLAWKDKQSISRRGDCNIDAVFIRLIIAKHCSAQVFGCLVVYVWNPSLLTYFRVFLEIRKNSNSKWHSS